MDDTHPTAGQDSEGRLLLVEDDPDFRLGLTRLLAREGFDVRSVATLADARTALSRMSFDATLLDLTLPDASGVTAIRSVLDRQPECALVVLTGSNDAELAVRALQLGARDYLTKPVRAQTLLASIRPAVARRRAMGQALDELAGGSAGEVRVLGDSPAWRAALEMVAAAAAVPRTTVLLTGEPGVGKELAARLVHRGSANPAGPFVAINVACLPGSLVESELFGHEAGAFTGAQRVKRGVFEQAAGGTLFLDEIGELPLELQSKLLRVLEGQPFRRLGGEREVEPRCRVVSATNQALPKLVAEGRFRSDLYHRLRVLEIPLPPLRERGDDVARLAVHFLARLGAEMGWPQASIGAEAMACLEDYRWPGNVRELRNVIERALVLSRGSVIGPYHLPNELRQGGLAEPLAHDLRSDAPAPGPALRPDSIAAEDTEPVLLEEVVRRHVDRVLQSCGGNVSEAARRLGISRQTLRRKLREDGG